MEKNSGEGAQPPSQTPPPWGGGYPLPTLHPLRPLGSSATRPHPPTSDFWIRHCVTPMPQNEVSAAKVLPRDFIFLESSPGHLISL